MSTELEQERRDFIDDKQERLSEMEGRIQQLRSRLEHEEDLVSESQLAEWDQELFELEQERKDVQAKLERARTASPAEWEAMRGDLALQTDRIEAGLETAGNRIEQLFSTRDKREPVRGTDEGKGAEQPSSESESEWQSEQAPSSDAPHGEHGERGGMPETTEDPGGSRNTSPPEDEY